LPDREDGARCHSYHGVKWNWNGVICWWCV